MQRSEQRMRDRMLAAHASHNDKRKAILSDSWLAAPRGHVGPCDLALHLQCIVTRVGSPQRFDCSGLQLESGALCQTQQLAVIASPLDDIMVWKLG